MKKTVLTGAFIALMMSFLPIYASGQSSAGDKPGTVDAVVTTIQATVEAVDQENRKVTLKDPEGDVVTIDVDENVKNLAQVKVGDILTVDYIEAVTIQVLDKDAAVEAGATAGAAVGTAEPGQKPGAVVVDDITVVVTIEAIDKEQQLVTLKNAEGETKTVKARNPDNLEKVVVGDKVMISYTTALGISVTEK